MYSFESGFSGISYVVKNTGASALKFTHDCRKSKNLQSNQSSLITTQIVPPGEAKVTHHLAPKDCGKDWKVKAKTAWEFL